MIIYEAYNTKNGKSYIGLTKNSIDVRKSQHESSARRGSLTYFHNALRKYGGDSFEWSVMMVCSDMDTLKRMEVMCIGLLEEWQTYNMTDGGDGGFCVPDHKKELWKRRLSEARKGRKPALGMKHTESNKKLFSECSKRKELKYPELDAINTSFKDANNITGISKTHFYRLRKKQIVAANNP